MLASTVFKKTKGTGSASNKALKTTPFGRSDAFTRGGFAMMPHATAPLSLMLCSGMIQLNKQQQRIITSVTQILAVLVYFLILDYSVLCAFIYASFFAVAAPFSQRGAFSSHASDNRFIFTAITIATDMLAVILAFANAYQIYGGVFVNGVAAVGFADHLYFSVVTFTTLGYGDFLPTGTTRFIAAFQALLGYAYFAVIIGISASLFYEHLRKT